MPANGRRFRSGSRRIADAAFDGAVERAAELLSASRLPLIGGLGTDVAGAAAAFRLAALLGGAIDHAGSEANLRDQAVLHDIGLMLVSPGEARQRADTFLVVGDGALAAWPELPDFLFGEGRTHFSEETPARRIVALTGGEMRPRHERNVMTWLGADLQALPSLLAAIRARVNGRPLSGGFDSAEVDRLAGTLATATFGVALWRPAELDALTIEMLVGLVKDLNAGTRWSGLSVTEDPSAAGAAMAAGWMTGLPLRTGFARSYPEHDPWRFDARRLVESGEADTALWISTLGEPVPTWLIRVPAVVVADPSIPTDAAIVLPVGRPGLDHDAILYDRRTGTLVDTPATAPSDLPTTAEALDGIAERLAAP